jgi:hypothetical protein
LVMLWGCLQLLLYFQVGFLAVSRWIFRAYTWGLFV